MKDKILELVKLRNEQEELSENYKEAFKSFTDNHAFLIDHRKVINDKVAALELSIRADAVEGFQKDGEKQREFGVGIRITKSFNYDSKVAFDWAKSHKLALQLDKKAFESIAKSQELSFVKLEEKAGATLPKEFLIEGE